MNEDPRFPNRKKKDWDSPLPGDTLTDADPKDPNGEPTNAALPTFSSYKIIDAAPAATDDKPLEPAQYPSVGAPPEPVLYPPISATSEASSQKPIVAPPIPPPPLREALIERIRIFAQNPTRVYAAAGVGLGILLGVVIAIVLWLTGNPEGRYDLGSVTSNAAGLKGHLFIEWDKKVNYRLTLEPSDPDLKAGFALAVSSSPRPLSIEVHLQDSQGFALCAKNIVLRFDARKAAALVASMSDTQADTTDADKTSDDQLAQSLDIARLEAQEPGRELGKDLFQNQIGPDGQIAAINAQGEIPCSKKAYENTVSWSFSPNFPSLAEQNELLKRQEEKAKAERLASEELVASKRRVSRPAVAPLPFSIEGDDVIVEFDADHGVIETRGRKTFFFDRTSGAVTDSRWQDYPVSIHYRCDRSSNCTVMHQGLGALRTRMRR